MKNTTLLFLVKRMDGRISELCLALKKRGFGVGRWNAVGGKVTESETIEEAAKREAFEEIGVEAGQLKKVAKLSFTFPHMPEWDQAVHVFITESWQGEPTESEEMKPWWYKIDSLPFDSMWPDDMFWVPLMVKDKLVRGKFIFAEGDKIVAQEVQTVPDL